MIETYWISNNSLTIGIIVEDGIIKNIPPILHKFKGQSFENLKNWLICKFGNNIEIFLLDDKNG